MYSGVLYDVMRMMCVMCVQLNGVLYLKWLTRDGNTLLLRLVRVHVHIITCAGTVKFWDMRNMHAPTFVIRHNAGVNKLAVSPNGSILAVPLDNR